MTHVSLYNANQLTHTVKPLVSEMAGNLVYILDMRGLRIREVRNELIVRLWE